VKKTNLTIFAFSDATGELAQKASENAMRQFKHHKANVIRVSKISTVKTLEQNIKKAKEQGGIIAFTFVSRDMRDKAIEFGAKYEVPMVDLLGPFLGILSTYFHESPSSEPGLQYKLTQNYFKRTEAVEFAVKHDDGQNLNSVEKADIVLLGISRTSKTPLSIFMAYHGYRCANIPIVQELSLPAVIKRLKKKQTVGLTISPRKLMEIRTQRLKKIGRPTNEPYAQLPHIRKEIDYAKNLFEKLGIFVVDVTEKAIEETATEIIKGLKI